MLELEEAVDGDPLLNPVTPINRLLADAKLLEETVEAVERAAGP